MGEGHSAGSTRSHEGRRVAGQRQRLHGRQVCVQGEGEGKVQGVRRRGLHGKGTSSHRQRKVGKQKVYEQVKVGRWHRHGHSGYRQAEEVPGTRQAHGKGSPVKQGKEEARGSKAGNRGKTKGGQRQRWARGWGMAGRQEGRSAQAWAHKACGTRLHGFIPGNVPSG